MVEADDHVGIGPSAEQFTVDALGNRLRKSQVGIKESWHPDHLGIRRMTYDGNARIVGVVDTIAADGFELSETYSYDGAGVLTLQYSREQDNFYGPGGGATADIFDQTRSYPAVDEKISVVNRHVGISQASDESFPGRHQVYQENWYDALGRRVFASMR